MHGNDHRRAGSNAGEGKNKLPKTKPAKPQPEQKNDTVGAANGENGLPSSESNSLTENKAVDGPSTQTVKKYGEDLQPEKQTSPSGGQDEKYPSTQVTEEAVSGHKPRGSISLERKVRDIVTISGNSLWTNVSPLFSKSKLSLYEISCHSKGRLTKLEERWLIQAFRTEYNIVARLGSLVFVDNKHFMTFNNENCFDGNIYYGNIKRQDYRPDESYKRIYIGREPGRMVWSLLEGQHNKSENDHLDDQISTTGSSITSMTSAASGKSLGSIQVYASCRAVGHFDFTELSGTAPTIKKFASALERFELPRSATGAASNPFIREQLVVHGNKTFDFATKGQSIGFGLESRAGIESTIRTSSDGLMNIVTSCQRVFYAPLKLSTFIARHKPDFAIDSCGDIEDLNDTLRGLCIMVKKANGGEKLGRICAVTSTCPADTFFRPSDKDPEISVENHFVQNRHIILTGVDQPCINVGSIKWPQYFPTGVCQILPGQSFGKRLPLQAQVNLQKLRNWESNRGDEPHLKQVDKRRNAEQHFQKQHIPLPDIASTWRGLPAVHDIRLNGQCKIEPLRLSLESESIKTPGTSFTNHPFSLYLAQVGNGPSLCKSFRPFSLILHNKAKALGMKGVWPPDTAVLKLSDPEDHWRKSVLEKRLTSSTKDQIPMVLAVIDGGTSNKKAYNQVKSSFTLEHGLQSTCISTSTLEKAHSKDDDNGLDKYADAFLRKVLAKAEVHSSAVRGVMHGTHHISSQKQGTVFIGFHVAHLSRSMNEKERSGCRRSAVTVATKFLGEDGPYKASTELVASCATEKDGLNQALRNHFKKLNIGDEQSHISQMLLFKSGANQLHAPEPVLLNGFKRLTVNTDAALKPDLSHSITSEEAEQFRLLCTNDLQGATGIYIAMEKPAKIEFYGEKDKHLERTASKETGKCERVAWVIQSNTTDSADRELFIMKESKDTNQHYPLRVKAHIVNGSMEPIALQKLVRRIMLLDARNGSS